MGRIEMKIPRAAGSALAMMMIAAMIVLLVLAGGAQGGQGAHAAFGQAEAETSAAPHKTTATPAPIHSRTGETSKPSNAAPLLTGVRTVDGTSEIQNGEAVSCETSGQSAVLVKNGGSLTMNNTTVVKSGDAPDPGPDGAPGDTGDDDPDGVPSSNAAACIASGGSLTASGGSISSAAQGSDAIFATGSGTSARVSDATVTTAGNFARGIAASDGAIVSVTNVGITTGGSHSAAVAASEDGAVEIGRATISTAGEDSPLVTANGSVTGANLTGAATGSSMIAVDGGAVNVTDSDLTGAGPCGIALYQSGDNTTANRTSTFSAAGGKLSSMSEGPFFFVTNTKAEAKLTGCELTFSSGILAQVSRNVSGDRGAPGENGGDFQLSTTGQVLSGDVMVDAISSFSLSLTRGSIYTGAVDSSNVGKSVSLSLDADSSWTMTADSHVDALTDAMLSLENIQSCGFMLYYDAENPACAWLRGATVPLPGGGLLTPEP